MVGRTAARVVRSNLVALAQRGLEMGAAPEALAAAVGALGELAAQPEMDVTLDKWLYRAIARCVESRTAQTGALELADKLEARLAKKPPSVASVALAAGAAMNAARLELEAILAAPHSSAHGIAAFVARGICGVATIAAARRVAAATDGGVSVPARYADALRAVLARGARVIETTAPNDAWTVRRLAVEARLAAAPDDADGTTIEALRGLATHMRHTLARGGTAAIFRAAAFASLEPVLEPWRAAPPTVCEWFFRRAAALDAAGDSIEARVVRAEGRARVGTARPLLVGVLLCGDVEYCAVVSAPALLIEASRCFSAALNESSPGDARTWRRAWDALARATAAVGDDAPAAEAAISTLGDVCARAALAAASINDTLAASGARLAAADAYQRAAILGARRGDAAAAENRCATAEHVVFAPVPAAGRAAVGISLLRCAQTICELQIATSVLERAVCTPGTSAAVWTSLAHGLLRLGRAADASAAAATAAALANDIAIAEDAVAIYTRAATCCDSGDSVRIPSLVSTLRLKNTELSGVVLCVHLRVAETGSSDVAFEVAAFELAAWNGILAAPVLAHAAITLVQRGLRADGLVLAARVLAAADTDSLAAALARCAFAASAVEYDSVAGDDGRTVALRNISVGAVKGFAADNPTDVNVTDAAVAVRDAAAAADDCFGEARACEALAAVIPRWRPAAIIAAAAAATRGGFARLAQKTVHVLCAPTYAPDNIEVRHVGLVVRAVTSDGSDGGLEARLLGGIDAARAARNARAAAEVVLALLNARLWHGDSSGAASAAAIASAVAGAGPRRRRRHGRSGVLLADSPITQECAFNTSWDSLAQLWLMRGCGMRASAYKRCATEGILGPANVALGMAIAATTRNWRGVTAFNYLCGGVLTERKMCVRVRTLEHAIAAGDIARARGNLRAAAVCYDAAYRVFVCLNDRIAEAAVLGRASTLPHAGKMRCVFGYVATWRAHAAVTSGAARVHELRSKGPQTVTYHIAMHDLPQSALENARARYRLGRRLLMATGTAAAAAADEVMTLLRTATLGARGLGHSKLAANSARALTVALLRFMPGAATSPLVALLAHASVGTGTAAVDHPGGALATATARVDTLLNAFLSADCESPQTTASARVALDSLLAPLPASYTVAAILVAPTGHLIVARLQRGRAPLTLASRLPRGWHAETPRSPVGACIAALRASSAGLQAGSQASPHVIARHDYRAGWWRERRALDAVLEAGLKTLDRVWLGALRALLATEPAGVLCVENNMCAMRHRIQRLCSAAAPHVSTTEAAALLRATGAFEVKTLHESISAAAAHGKIDLQTYHQVAMDYKPISPMPQPQPAKDCTTSKRTHFSLATMATRRQPLILVLDERLRCLPVEDLAVPRASPTSRVPSLALTLVLSARMFRGSRRHLPPPTLRVCSVIDPDANLPATRRTLASYVTGDARAGALEWSSAVLGESKATEEIAARVAMALPSCAAYLFCGHGHGASYLRTALEARIVRSATLLIGCSSGTLADGGKLAPRGLVLELLAKGAPTVVATLWDVTDRDMDRFTIALLHSIASNPTSLLPDLLTAAKAATKLRNLNGAASVCYGLPISLEDVEHARNTLNFVQNARQKKR